MKKLMTILGLILLVTVNINSSGFSSTDKKVKTSNGKDTVTEKNVTKEIEDNIDVDNAIEKNLPSNSFNGIWCNSDSWDKTGEIFQLEISSDKKEIINATFFSGGPFEERYRGKLSAEGKLDLYFDGVGGSISFNEVSNANDRNSDLNCKKIKYAICKLIGSNKIQIVTYRNNCSYMPANVNIVLKKLKEGESCGP